MASLLVGTPLELSVLTTVVVLEPESSPGPDPSEPLELMLMLVLTGPPVPPGSVKQPPMSSTPIAHAVVRITAPASEQIAPRA